METQTFTFLIILIAIAAVGVAVFLIALIVRLAGRPGGEGQAAHRSPAAPGPPPWAQGVLALAGLAALVVVLVWLIVEVAQRPADAEGAVENGKALAFIILMAVIAGGGLFAYLLYLLARPGRGAALATGRGGALAAATVSTEAATGKASTGSDAPQATPHSMTTPSAVRLIGLLGIVAALLLLMWVHLSRLQEHVLMTHLLYPAAFAIAVVLLFDKATRAWSLKAALDSGREWLLCDLMVFLLALGYFNLLSAKPNAEYRGHFWDMVFLSAFFVVFWVLDRKVTRLRFLLTYLFFLGVPILLLIWRAVQGGGAEEGEEGGVGAAETGATAGAEAASEGAVSWWEGLWPFFFWCLIFTVFEIIALVASERSGAADTPVRQGSGVVSLVRDGVFVIGCAILLIIAA